MEKINLEKNLRILKNKLSENGKITFSDAVSILGTPVLETREILNFMIERYNCNISVTDKGSVIYDFGNLKRRNSKGLKEVSYEILEAVWKVFTWIFKAWITVFLIVYFVIFLLLLIAILVAAASGGKDNKKSSSPDISKLLGGIMRGLFYWNMTSKNTTHQTDAAGYRYKTYEPVPAPVDQYLGKKPKKSFITSVFDFVFGPARFELTVQDNFTEIVSYLRKNRGVISKFEMKGLAGWTSDKLEDFFSECVAKFNGIVEISSEGLLYARFPELLYTSGNSKDGKIEWYWDEYEDEYKVTGNTGEANFGIFAMNIFNLVFSGAILFGFIDQYIDPYVEVDRIVFFWLGIIPFIFSFLFFLIPAIRSLLIRPKIKQREINNIRKRLTRAVYLHNSPIISKSELMNKINSNKSEELLTFEKISKIIEDFVFDWKGEINFDNFAEPVYDFSKLREELNGISQLRKTVDFSSAPGNIIMETDN